jgi:hypothetical protein
VETTDATRKTFPPKTCCLVWKFTKTVGDGTYTNHVERCHAHIGDNINHLIFSQELHLHKYDSKLWISIPTWTASLDHSNLLKLELLNTLVHTHDNPISSTGLPTSKLDSSLKKAGRVVA